MRPSESPNLIRLQGMSRSLIDSIDAGDQFVIETADAGKLRRGDILVFKRAETIPVCLRLLRTSRTKEGEYWFCLAGDRFPLDTEWIDAAVVVGRIDAVIKPGGDKLSGTGLKLHNQWSLCTRHLPAHLFDGIKRCLISFLSICQSFTPYRKLLGRLLGSRIYLHREFPENRIDIFAKLGRAYAGSAELTVEKDGSGFIANLQVRARFRGLGIARKMMLEILEEARRRRIPKITLTVWEKNREALGLYRSLGFKEGRDFLERSHRWPGTRRMLHMYR